MNQEFINKITEQFTQGSAPVKQLNGLFVNYAEKLAQFQLQAAQGYADFGLEQLRGAAKVQNPQELQGYVQAQTKAAESFGQKVKADAETLVELNKSLGGELQKIVQGSVAKAKPARKAA